MSSKIFADFSTNRLQGEPLPADVERLLEHRDELLRHTGVELVSDAGWAPWLDTSYLSDAERAAPQIAANLRAIEDVFLEAIE